MEVAVTQLNVESLDEKLESGQEDSSESPSSDRSHADSCCVAGASS